MQIEMYQHAFQISSIEVYCIWLERGLRRLQAIWIVTEGKCTTRLAFPMFSALDRCVMTGSWKAGLFWLKVYCLNITEHFLNTVPVNCFTQQKWKVKGRFCLPHSVFISLAHTLTTKTGPVSHPWPALDHNDLLVHLDITSDLWTIHEQPGAKVWLVLWIMPPYI